MKYNVEELCRIGPPAAMAFLISAAERRETVGYEDVAHYIGRTVDRKFYQSKHHIGNVVGTLMDRILRISRNAPLINTLVVSQAGTEKGLPGHGADWYVDNYLNVPYGKLSAAQKREALRPVHEAVWNFEDWRSIGRRAFGTRFVPPPKKRSEQDGKSRRLGLGGPPESDEHRKLKEYVATHPRRFGAPEGCTKGETEKRIQTSDEIDVWFMFPGEELAVEVKSVRSNDVDRQRGLFQCVKYRALLEAQSKIDKSEAKIRARLVTEVPLSGRLQRWARALKIEVQVIGPIN